jgi:hypothetical protein
MLYIRPVWMVTSRNGNLNNWAVSERQNQPLLEVVRRIDCIITLSAEPLHRTNRFQTTHKFTSNANSHRFR